MVFILINSVINFLAVTKKCGIGSIDITSPDLNIKMPIIVAFRFNLSRLTINVAKGLVAFAIPILAPPLNSSSVMIQMFIIAVSLPASPFLVSLISGKLDHKKRLPTHRALPDQNYLEAFYFLEM